MVTLVLPLWVMKLTNSPLLVSGVNVAIATTAILFAPVTGTLADRMSRRKLMIIADVMRCIVMILIAVIAFYNKMLYIPLLILLIIRSIGECFIYSGFKCSISNICGRKACSTGDYAEANINTNHIGSHSFNG